MITTITKRKEKQSKETMQGRIDKDEERGLVQEREEQR